MKSANVKFKSIDDYIATFPKDVQDILEKIRQTIRKAAPDAKETIKYHMPTFTVNGNLVYFAANKKHIGVYGITSAAIDAFKKELAPYATPKGTLQFPLGKPMPYDLIQKVVEFKAKQHREKGG